MILTERDKKLLYILGVMVVLAMGVYLLLLPAYSGYTEIKQQLDKANADYDQRQVIINAAGVTQASIVELRQQLVAEQTGFPSVVHNLDLDRMHTLRAVMQLCEPTELDMRPMEPMEIVGFGTTVDAEGNPAEAKQGSTAWLAASQLTMAATGRQSDAVALIDTIVNSPDEQLETLRITPMEMELGFDEDGNAIVSVEEDNPYMTIELVTRQFYALNQQTPELELPGISLK